LARDGAATVRPGDAVVTPRHVAAVPDTTTAAGR
jgi:hypothetical protein